MQARRILRVATLSLSLAAFSGCATDNPVSSLSGTDASAPGAPISLVAELRGNDLVLTWDASVDADVAGYDVYRYSPDPARENSYVKINGALVTDTEFMVIDAPSIASWYRIKAVDSSANASAASGALSATAPATTTNSGVEPAEPGIEKQLRP